MKTVKKILVTLIILFGNYAFAFSQNRLNLNKFEIGIGISTNSLIWNIYDSINKKEIDLIRNKIEPTIFPRITYTRTILKSKGNEIDLSIFCGYYKFGGTSKIEPNEYQDKFNFYSIEYGLLPKIVIKKKIEIGIGLKGQSAFKKTRSSFGYVAGVIDDSTKWQTTDIKDMFQTFSGNLGITIKYRINKSTIGLEVWKGISNLNKIFPPGYKPVIRENNFRLIYNYNILKIISKNKKSKP